MDCHHCQLFMHPAVQYHLCPRVSLVCLRNALLPHRVLDGCYCGKKLSLVAECSITILLEDGPGSFRLTTHIFSLPAECICSHVLLPFSILNLKVESDKISDHLTCHQFKIFKVVKFIRFL